MPITAVKKTKTKTSIVFDKDLLKACQAVAFSEDISFTKFLHRLMRTAVKNRTDSKRRKGAAK